MAQRQSEREFQGAVLELAGYLGWRLQYHTFDSRGSERGFPDLVLCRPRDGRLLIVELKSATGRVSEDQRAWLDGLGTVRQFGSGLWRPGDWAEIERMLR